MPYMLNAFHGGGGVVTGSQTIYALTVINPGADTNVANWTNDLGTVGRRTASPAPHSGAGYFFGGTTAECRCHQDIAIPGGNTAQVDTGSMLARVRWYQAGFDNTDTDEAEMEIEFFDGSPGSSLGARQSFGLCNMRGATGWILRERHVAVPTLTRTIRLYMHMLRHAGTNCDGYIDDIGLDLLTHAVVVANLTVVNPGANTDVSSWTNDTGTIARKTATPSPFEGAGYFWGSTSGTVVAHQDIAVPGNENTPIDAGLRRARLQWQQQGLGTEVDHGELELEFYDSGPSIIGTATLGGLVHMEAAWKLREVYVDIPATTRTIRVIQHMLRPSGTNNDVYIDDIQLAIIVKPT